MDASTFTIKVTVLQIVCCAENLEHWFCSESWTEKHSISSKCTINQVVVYRLDCSDIKRPIVEPKFGTLSGGKGTFAFLASLHSGVVGARHWGGWCEGCQRGFAPGDGLTSRLEVPGCSCADADRGPWVEQVLKRRDASGIANRRKVAQDKGHKLRGKEAQGGHVGCSASTREVVNC